MTAVCHWRYDEYHDKYDTECGEAWQLMDGTPEENGMRFCPHCGRPLGKPLVVSALLDAEELDEEDDDDDE